MHHYMTKYIQDGKNYCESWLQVNLLFGYSICFNRRRIEI